MSFIIDLVRSSKVRAATEMIEISFLIELTKATSLGHDLFPEDKLENLKIRLFIPFSTVLISNTNLLHCRLQ
jgi:hypothetical protein